MSGQNAKFAYTRLHLYIGLKSARRTILSSMLITLYGLRCFSACSAAARRLRLCSSTHSFQQVCSVLPIGVMSVSSSRPRNSRRITQNFQHHSSELQADYSELPTALLTTYRSTSQDFQRTTQNFMQHPSELPAAFIRTSSGLLWLPA